MHRQYMYMYIIAVHVFNVAVNRIKAADITQLRYLFDMYYRVFYNKNINENPESIFLFLSSVGKNTELRIQPKELKLIKYCK